MNVDLHSHSTCSDGALSPAALLERARDQGVTALSITDHDTVAAYAPDDLDRRGIELVPGVEFSTHWQGRGIHVVGLNIDPRSDTIGEGVALHHAARAQRGAVIAERLAKLGLRDCLEGARALAGNSAVGRPDFAKHLVAAGHVATEAAAYKQYLGDGKLGDVREYWAELAEVIRWIRAAGGIAVLAHPLKYRLTRSKLKRLLKDFVAAGGTGLEVVSGHQLAQRTEEMGRLCREAGLLASRGSDFHAPGAPWSELGRASPLPRDVTPVWEAFD
ncbi:MAG: PHP domain-containing protein [Pseudomonadota bacterium]